MLNLGGILRGAYYRLLLNNVIMFIILWSLPVLFGLCETFEGTSTEIINTQNNNVLNETNALDVTAFTKTNSVLNTLEIAQATEFLITTEYATEKIADRETTATEFKQAVAVTPAGEVKLETDYTTENDTIDGHNRELTTSFEITDWEGSKSKKVEGTSTEIINTQKNNVLNETSPSDITVFEKKKSPVINNLEIAETTEFLITTEYATEETAARETTATEFKQAVAVTPAEEIEMETEREPISNLICEQCVCANGTVDCQNRELTTSFEITDWEGLETFNPITIDLSSNPLTKFNRISSLPTVQYLNLSNCGLVDIQYASFSYLQDLVSLDLSNNHLETSSINKRVFVGIINPKLDRIVPFTKIRYLSLANNDIHSLTQDVFVFMNELTSLDLSGNPLGNMDQVTMGAITDLVNLKNLNLRGCDLETLPEGLLRRLRKLVRLDLSNNRFTTVPVVISEAVNLLYLDLGGNLFETLNQSTAISNLTKLEELRLCELNKLTKITDGALGGLKRLVSLHLCYNPRLTILEDGFLVWKDEQIEQELWPRPKELYLNNNNLSMIYSAYLDSWDRLTNMDFSNNPYRCDCKNQWIIDILVPIIKSLKFNDTISNMVCMYPEEMRGMSFAELHNASKILPCNDPENLKEFTSPNMAILLGVMIGILITFPLVLVIVLLWKNGYFAKWKENFDSSSEDEETDAF